MLAWIQLILNLPSVINSLWARIQSLEDSIVRENKQKESAAISAAQTQMNQAQTSDEILKAAQSEADTLRHL